jgi:DNA-binding CsgD family transcriptional regulator
VESESGTERPPIADQAALLAKLASLIGFVGKPEFYDQASVMLASALHCKRRLVMRYSAYDKPAFIVNQALNDQGVTYYLAGLYRIDPLHRLARTNVAPTVVNLRALAHEIDEKYFLELGKMSIFDELAVVLPAYGGVTIAFCCERHRVRFEQQDYDLANAFLPLLDELHRLHMDRLFSAARTIGREPLIENFGNALLVLDRRGGIAYANDAWSKNANAANALPQVIRQIAESGASHLQLDEQQVIHWEQLPADFSLAPSGHLVIVEHRSPGPLATSGDAALAAFCRQRELTPREAEIVRLSFVGLTNAAIAKQLGVSVGTVKNHRWRLYYKLDITTERELFHLFLSTLLCIERSAGKPEVFDVKEPTRHSRQAV